MNVQPTSGATPDVGDAETQVLPDFKDLQVEQAALITCRQGKQHVALLGPDWHAEIRRMVNGAEQPYLSVSFHQGVRNLTETVNMQLVRFPKLERERIYRAEVQHIDAVPTVVFTLADDFRVLFSAGIDAETIGVEFADPDEAVA